MTLLPDARQRGGVTRAWRTAAVAWRQGTRVAAISTRRRRLPAALRGARGRIIICHLNGWQATGGGRGGRKRRLWRRAVAVMRDAARRAAKINGIRTI